VVSSSKIFPVLAYPDIHNAFKDRKQLGKMEEGKGPLPVESTAGERRSASVVEVKLLFSELCTRICKKTISLNTLQDDLATFHIIAKVFSSASKISCCFIQ